jgi:hypothetical protein
MAMLIVALIVAFVGTVVWGVIVISDRTNENCARIHQLVKTLDTILASGEVQTRQYVAEGVLTPVQGNRADLYRERQRTLLASADCEQE